MSETSGTAGTPGTDAGPELEREVGVGPWPGGRDAWPTDPRLDPELLEHGDRRNVVDGYRYWSLEAVVADLETRRTPLHVAIENLAHDANIGSIVRTANAYNVAGVHVIGRRRWNRRGAMVTDRYLSVHHHPDAAAFATWALEAGVAVVGIDNVPGSRAIETGGLPVGAVLVFGSEGPGLSPELLAACQEVRHITQHGSTRSLNAGAAAAVAMYAWASEHLPVDDVAQG